MPKPVSVTLSSILDGMGVFDPIQRDVMTAYTEALITMTLMMKIGHEDMRNGFFIIEELLKAELREMDLKDSPKRKGLAPPSPSDRIH